VTTTRPQPLVLVVDDNDAGRFVKSQVARRAGFDVVEAATGRRALELVHGHPVDIVLLDVNLPDVSGIEVCGQIKTDETLAAVQVLQISATAVADDDRVRGLAGGADAYLTEPGDPDVLAATLHALMRVRRAELDLAAALDRERDARAIAESANRVKDDFLATLSHELRTPLNAMIGWISQLRAGTLDDKGRDRALAALERSTRVQWRLVNELLDSASIAKGKLRLDTTIVDLQAVAAAAAESIRDDAARRHVDLIVEGKSVKVRGDGPRLQQVLTNLLNNAVQFTASGGRVLLTVDVVDGNAEVAVQDTGIGIDPALLPHVFEPFHQGDVTVRQGHAGLGLGLSISRQLIEMHGGKIVAESAGIGHGALFTVRLPLPQPDSRSTPTSQAETLQQTS
jgi:two-component system, sensor histidine kinase